MKFILGEKIQMTQFFDANGAAHAATIVFAGPVVVTQVKTKAVDGYSAVQVGFGSRKEKNIAKPQLGAWKKVAEVLGEQKDLANFHYTREFLVSESDIESYKVGDVLSATMFQEGDNLVVSGTSKGKGFQGVVKRHGFHGGPRTHGQKHSEREAGSIGGSGGRAGGRVAKGMRMAGRMGSDRVTIKGLKVLAVDGAENLIVVSGAIPGRRGTLVELIA